MNAAPTPLRFLAADAVEEAGSGHPGMLLGAAPMAYVLWDRFLKHNPSSPEWPHRDRFVLSTGHGLALLYALLHLYGHDLPLTALRNFRQLHSKMPGHPEYGHTPGVETTTGPLGQGFANGVGLGRCAVGFRTRLTEEKTGSKRRAIAHEQLSYRARKALVEGIRDWTEVSTELTEEKRQ